MDNQGKAHHASTFPAVYDRYGELLTILSTYRGERAFNQYRDEQAGLDRPHGGAVRRRNLRTYLDVFTDARFILVGEAAGYAGCRFSGIPFTCEKQLVGGDRLAWAGGLPWGRSSSAEQPWVERSATIVWGALGGSRACVLWNAFPWHPYGASGPLSNRPPGRDLHDGLDALRCVLSLFPGAQPCAVGRVAERALASIGVAAPYLRHPSHGGKTAFSAGVESLLSESALQR